jgi:hypothetical protein
MNQRGFWRRPTETKQGRFAQKIRCLLAPLLLSGCAAEMGGPGPISEASVKHGDADAPGYGWRVEADDTLAFSGQIDGSTSMRFMQLVTDRVRTVVVNSAGGEVAAAVDVAMEIYRRRISLVIRGYCLSSCANYWATAAERVTLDNGFLGFHGNLTSCVALSGGIDAYVRKDLPSDAPDEKIENVTRLVEESMRAEDRYYTARGIDPLVIITSARPDKGLGDSRVYALIAPTPAELKQWGVNIVAGEQSRQMIARFDAQSNLPVAFRKP